MYICIYIGMCIFVCKYTYILKYIASISLYIYIHTHKYIHILIFCSNMKEKSTFCKIIHRHKEKYGEIKTAYNTVPRYNCCLFFIYILLQYVCMHRYC